MTAFLAEISAFLMADPGVSAALVLGSAVGGAVGWHTFLRPFRESLPPKSRGWGTAMGALALGALRLSPGLLCWARFISWGGWPGELAGAQHWTSGGLAMLYDGLGARISREPWLTTALLSLLLLGNLFRYWLFHTDWPHLWGNLLFLAAGGGFMELAAGRR